MSRWKRRPITGFVPSLDDEREVLEAGRMASTPDAELEPDDAERHFRAIMEEA